MANRIYRTITYTACNGQHLNTATGEFEDYCDVIIGDYTPARATRYLRRVAGDDSITINNVEQETKKYQMDVQTFIEYAEQVD